MILPADTPLPDPRAICQVVLDDTGDTEPVDHAPVELFSAHYNANNGDLMSLSPSRNINANDNLPADKGKAVGLPSKSPARPSRNGKRQTTSPRRRAAAGATAALVNVVTQLSQPPSTNNIDPPQINRDGTSPNSVINTVFDLPVPTTAPPKQKNQTNYGCLPKSTFMKFARPEYFTNKIKYTDNEIKKGLKQCRMPHTFNLAL